MIKFRYKNFTIPEGHYTGPKNIDGIPGYLELATKGVLIGSGVGAVGGAVIPDVSIEDGAITGAKAGLVGGILTKLLNNHIHKPMGSIKFQEVDKAIRRQFGIYQIVGIEVDGNLDKRAKLEDRFSFNDRQVTKYKINVAICNNSFTMYTFGISSEELDKVSKILDSYCKKYYGMEYDSILINPKLNSYSVAIIFTNVGIISDFLMEISKNLDTKINLLDSKAIVLPRIEEAGKEEMGGDEEKTFSGIPSFNTFDLIKILSSNTLLGLTRGLKGLASEGVLGALLDATLKLGDDEKQRLGLPVSLGSLNNNYLITKLKELHFAEGFHYTIGGSMSGAKGRVNMAVSSGLFYVTSDKKNEDYEDLEKVYDRIKGQVRRIDTGKVCTYVYMIKSDSAFKNILSRFMKTGIKFNIFEESVKDTKKKFFG